MNWIQRSREGEHFLKVSVKWQHFRTLFETENFGTNNILHNMVSTLQEQKYKYKSERDWKNESEDNPHQDFLPSLALNIKTF